MRRAAGLGLWLLAAACGSGGEQGGSRGGSIEQGLQLPAALREVSGIVAMDARTMACVQDELGVLYLVDLLGERPPRAMKFGKRGDYEGLAWTGIEFWVLRSDGRLLRVVAEGDRLVVGDEYRLPDDAEYEGLCFDAAGHRLLALPKRPKSHKKREKDRRRLLAFDLERNLVLAEPVLTLDLEELVEQAQRRDLPLPMRTTAKGKERVDLELRCSEIAVAPASGDLVLLSAVDHLLLRIDREGQLLATALLDPEALPQPEAMTFLPDGRLVVGSEGRDGPAVARIVALP